MAKNYSYALSIDLGIASIGTALIRLDTDGNALGILDAGVRTFETPLGAAERRAARQSRKTIRRRRQRLRNLQKLLQSYGLLPIDAEELKQLMKRSPYRLRAHGVRHKFTSLHELGRCLLHIAKFRGAGFLNQSEEDADISTEQKKKTTSTESFYRNLEAQLQHKNLSLGEYFMQRLRDNSVKKTVRRRDRFITENLVDYAVPRFLVKEDFHALWNMQATFYPELLSIWKEDIYQVIFSDRPHAPYATGVCSLDPDSGEERLPRLHRLSEERRIYEQINNLRYQTADASYSLTKEMRDALVYIAFSGLPQNKTSIKKKLQKYVPKKEKIIKINMPDEATVIKPLSHVLAFAHIAYWQNMSVSEQDNILEFIANPRLNPQDKDSRLMSEEQFLHACAERLHIPIEAQGLRLLSSALHILPKDRSALGISATQRILEKLRHGVKKDCDGEQVWYPLTFREAADACGYKAEEELKRSIAGTMEKLPYYGQVLRHDVTPVHPWHKGQAAAEEASFGRVPNPVVHVALNQLRKVVNEIIGLYGKPQRIHVELAREFGMSQKKRDELDAERKKRTKENEDFDKELRAHNIRPSRKNRIKYRLWKDQGFKDMYSLENISLTDFALCEVDHIIPQSRGGSDTYANLALTKADINLAKGDTYAHDFIQQKYPNQWQHILQKLSDKSFSKAKAWRFMPDAQQQFEKQGDADQTDHRLTDTSYMAKMAARYLSVLCENVIPVRGGITARLRHVWGLDGVEYELMGLPIRKEIIHADTGEIMLDAWGKELRNPEWKAKPRIDHRHHALDAIVLACTTRSMVQQMAKAEKRDRRLPDFPTPFGKDSTTFRAAVLQALRGVKVSPKAEHGLNDKLHDATKYRVICRNPRDKESSIIVYQRSFSNIKSKKDVNNIVFSLHTLPPNMPEIILPYEECVQKHNAIENKYMAAEQVLRERNISNRQKGLREVNIDEANIVKEALRLAQKIDGIGHKYKKVEPKNLVGVCLKKQCGFEPKNNLRVDFYVKQDGSIGWECISRFNANQKAFTPSWQELGGKLLWSVYKGDVLELNVDADMKAKLKMPVAEGKVLCKVQMFSKNICKVNILYDARELVGKESGARWTSGNSGLITFTKSQARKVELSPFGKILHKHVKLWHGKKKT